MFHFSSSLDIATSEFPTLNPRGKFQPGASRILEAMKLYCCVCPNTFSDLSDHHPRDFLQRVCPFIFAIKPHSLEQ
jgi:hypothetical protein